MMPYKTFPEWVDNIDILPREVRHIVEFILENHPNSYTKLTHLFLDSNQIKDVSPLASLTNLTYLELSGNQIKDISPLASLTNLTYLELSGNQIKDISPLASLTNLTYLDLNCNQIKDVSPLASLTNVTHFYLIRNKITDISPLASLTNLTNLDLYDNQIKDISPLASLTNLTHLNLQRNQITDVSPLASLTNLTNLDLFERTIPDYQYFDDCEIDNKLLLSFAQTMDLSLFSSLSYSHVYWDYVDLPRKYWQPLEKWSSTWILEEDNAEIRRLLIQQIGYERICLELEAVQLSTWREYSLLKIGVPQKNEEDIYLLKMTCPSTGYIHVLRVPPDINSALEAIKWVNWDINPEDFDIET